jgi:formylglycine-generating enzyme required for sulfatase activity
VTDLSDMSLQTKIDEEIQARLAWELLRLELDHWYQTGSLIHPHILTLIYQRRETLRQLAKDEAELLFRSALAAGFGIAEWVELAWAAGVPVDVICLEDLDRTDFRTRAAAVSALGALGGLQEKDGQLVRLIIKMLIDDYPQVRVAAIHALEQIQPEGEWRKHLVYECYVPAGEFVMGDDGTDLLGKAVPTHNVLVDAFYISKYPVTNAEYERYVDDMELEFELPEGKADHPVVDVSWHQARDYAVWAGMRLLTEAEWEKAASWASETVPEEVDTRQDKRAGNGLWQRFMGYLVKKGKAGQKTREQKNNAIYSKKQAYPWGNEPDPSRCNTRETGLGDTTPVGMFSPEGDSPYGCADMVGNVWEWTGSLYRDYPYQANDEREDIPLFDYRVIRGGSFFSHQGMARSAGRFGLGPYTCNLTRGFRLGLSANQDFC